MASPYTGNPTVDTFMFQAAPTTNYATSADAYAGSTGAGGIVHYNATFNLSSIPVGATVTSATLYINVKAVLGSNTYNVHRVLQNQNPATLTYNKYDASNNWNTAGMASGTDYSATVMGSLVLAATGDATFTLSAAEVALMITTNYGIMIKSADNANSKYINITNEVAPKPVLTINYTTSTGGQGFMIIGMG